MPIVRWDDSFSVGIAEIDAQHKRLVEMINELYDAMRQRKGKDVLSEILDGMMSYAAVHFATEEKYFVQYFYPETESHRKEHRDFKKKADEFKKRFESNEIGVAGEVVDFLATWLKSHIKGSDKKYGPFLNEKGLR
ncbi:MAG: bacteriohemerythrin [Thermodesulforhabdaceae bacterium]